MAYNGTFGHAEKTGNPDNVIETSYAPKHFNTLFVRLDVSVELTSSSGTLIAV